MAFFVGFLIFFVLFILFFLSEFLDGDCTDRLVILGLATVVGVAGGAVGGVVSDSSKLDRAKETNMQTCFDAGQAFVIEHRVDNAKNQYCVARANLIPVGQQ